MATAANTRRNARATDAAAVVAAVLIKEMPRLTAVVVLTRAESRTTRSLPLGALTATALIGEALSCIPYAPLNTSF